MVVASVVVEIQGVEEVTEGVEIAGRRHRWSDPACRPGMSGSGPRRPVHDLLEMKMGTFGPHGQGDGVGGAAVDPRGSRSPRTLKEQSGGRRCRLAFDEHGVGDRAPSSVMMF